MVPAGNACVTVTDGNGCHGSTCQQVTINSNPTPSISGTSTTCQGNAVTLSTGSYSSYSWSNGGGNAYSASYNTTVNACVTVTDGNGCHGSTCQQVTINSNPTPSISGTSSACQGNSVTLNTGSYSSYSWSNGGGNASSASYNTAVNACVTVTDGNGCQGSICQQVTINSNPTPSISGNTSACQGNSVTLNTGSYSSYSWNNGGGNSSSASYSTTGNVCVTVTDGNGCQGSACTNVTINPNPTPYIAGPSISCVGSLTLNTGAFATYSWSNGSTSSNATYTASGNSCVTVIDANGCQGSACQQISVVNSISPIISGPTQICNGSTITLTTGTYDTYVWNTGATTQSIVATTGGNYRVTVTAGLGCSAVATQSVTILTFVGPIITGSTYSCTPPITLGLTVPYDSYLWSTGETTPTINVSSTAVYYVTVTTGICSGVAHFAAVMGVPPNPTIAATGPTTFCNGSSVNLTINGGYVSYLWSNGSTNASSGAITTSGNYCCTVTNSIGCTAIACVPVTVNSFISPTITSNSVVACSSTSAVLSVGSYSSYLWSTGSTTPNITISSNGNYSVSVTNALGCSGVGTLNTNIPFKVTTTITSPTNYSGCGSVSLDGGAGFATYVWSNAATTRAISVTTSGTYRVTVSSASGCSTTASHTATVLANPNATITANNVALYCSGTSNVTLSVGANTSYHWSTGAATQTVTIAPGNPGTYCVTVTSSAGCTSSSCTQLTTSCVAPSVSVTPTTSITAITATANWIQPTCYYGYSLRISKHGLNTWTTYTSTPNTHYTFSGLLHNTSYDWQIRTNCNSGQTVVSPWSATQTFTTAARLQEGEFEVDNSFNAYPNPASEVVNISFTADKEEDMTIRMMDITGRIIYSTSLTAIIGENQHQINLSDFAKGVYLIGLQNSNGLVQKKMVVN